MADKRDLKSLGKKPYGFEPRCSDHYKNMKSNIHKKETFEDKFDRKYACWVRNNPKAWAYWKRRNRKLFRAFTKKMENYD